MIPPFYLRDLSLASFELPLGLFLSIFGLIFGAYRWWHVMETGVAATAGTVMLSALPLILGVQLLLAFLGADIANQPQKPVFRSFTIRKKPL